MRFGTVVLDAPDIKGLSAFYAALLGWNVIDEDDDWITIADPANPGSTQIAFQLAPDFVKPTWPAEGIPQQLHLDFYVPDIAAAEPKALELGATATGKPGAGVNGFRVYLDPAGHPFCLCVEHG